MATVAIPTVITNSQTENNLFNDQFNNLSNDQIIQICEKIGLVKEKKCQILCDKDKKQCLNVASVANVDGIDCCITHSKSTKFDIAPNAIPCRFIFLAELNLRNEKNHINTKPKEKQRRCHSISKTSNGERCQNACIDETNFCAIHKDSIDHFHGIEDFITYCGANTISGSPCKNKVANGLNTCHLHSNQSMEIKVDIQGHVQGQSSSSNPNPNQIPQENMKCAGITTKGTPCSRNGKTPHHDGKMYCFQHVPK